MRLTIVGANPEASGSECIVFGHVGRQSNAFTPITDAEVGRQGEIAFHGEWDERDMQFGVGAAHARALVGRRIHVDNCQTSGRIVLVTHRWSGVVQVNDIGRKYTIDLYSTATRLMLLDVVDEIMLDLTSLARADDGVIRLPKLTSDVLIAHARSDLAPFRLLDRDPDFDPGVWRRGAEHFRKASTSDLKFRLVCAVLPEIVARGPGAAPAPALPSPREDTSALRDQLRLLAASVEGLARRAATKA